MRPLRELITDRALRDASPCGSRSAFRPRRASPAALSRPSWPWRASAARPSRDPRGAAGRRRSRPSSTPRSGCSRSGGAADGGRVPRRARALVGVHRARRPSGWPRSSARIPTPEDLRAALAEAFDDPSLTIVYWLGDADGHWGDADGHRLDPPAAAPGRAVTEIADGDRLVAAIVHDSALEDDRAFIDTATSYALMTLENHRLVGADVVAAARGARVARAHPGRRGRRAPAHRARPARRRAAAARRAAHQARAGRRAMTTGTATAPRAPPRCAGSATTSRRRWRRSARWRAASSRRRSPTAGSSQALRAAALAARSRPRSWRPGPAPPARDREPPRTSAASRPFRTRRSTRAARARW